MHTCFPPKTTYSPNVQLETEIKMPGGSQPRWLESTARREENRVQEDPSLDPLENLCEGKKLQAYAIKRRDSPRNGRELGLQGTHKLANKDKNPLHFQGCYKSKIHLWAPSRRNYCSTLLRHVPKFLEESGEFGIRSNIIGKHDGDFHSGTDPGNILRFFSISSILVFISEREKRYLFPRWCQHVSLFSWPKFTATASRAVAGAIRTQQGAPGHRGMEHHQKDSPPS